MAGLASEDCGGFPTIALTNARRGPIFMRTLLMKGPEDSIGGGLSSAHSKERRRFRLRLPGGRRRGA